jgi:hypothetical protein
LGVEALECRCTPTVYLWNPTGENDWSIVDNWYNQTLGRQNNVLQNPTDQAPGWGDTAKFEGTVVGQSQNTVCNVDTTPDVANFTVDFGYTSTIQLKVPAGTALVALTVTGTLTFDGGEGATIKGGTDNLNDIPYLTVSGGLNWTGGAFDTLDVSALPGTTNYISSGSTKSLTKTLLSNGGTMTWFSGSVATANNVSTSLYTTGTFEMQSAGSWGTAGDGGAFVASGTLRKTTAATSKILVDFVNQGQFLIQDGTAELDGSARQGSLTNPGMGGQLTQLNGGFLKLGNTGNGAYNLYQGVLNGSGTIYGSLYNYGGDVQVQDAAGTPSTITVTQAYKQTDGSGHIGTLEIYIDSGGNGSLLSIGGAAKLAGTLKVHNTPYTGTANWTFMTYASVDGDFDPLLLSYDAANWNNGGQVYHFVPHRDATRYWLEPVSGG